MSIEFKMDGLERYQRWLAKMDSTEVAKTKDRILRKSGLQALVHLDDLTPARTGNLRNSFQFGDANNTFQIEVGKTSYLFVGTAVHYARYVNDGFTQKAGQFVPGYWQNGTFHYVPAAAARAQGIGGMVLTGKIVPGAHMFEKTMDRLQEDVPEITDFEFRRLYELLFQS
ncbi:HK97 gp10 family phage protein [Paenibacillus sp. BK720]|uniref:HK97 gp10 family phage protein n=1 Tax=Paenibacillus sp. BK720 TaxID=2587092 RepID=UPI001421FF8C|nr:HK97 gp10 family phage protein [Paenibacillus sp. BK720]NIK67932.1 hypothetical protein [Paenibacillus sp. BK720]